MSPGLRLLFTRTAIVLYEAGALGTFVFLTFFDGYRYNWFNWIVAVPVNAFSAAIWPLYWVAIRPIMQLLN